MAEPLFEPPSGPTPAARAALFKLLEVNDLSFRDFVEICLYNPASGYYAMPRPEASDYATSASISPVFSFALARLAEEFLEQVGDEVSAIVDVGCGDGSLLGAIHSELSRTSELQATSLIGVDRTLARLTPSAPGVSFTTSVDELPSDRPLLVISNELFDAFPFHRVVQRGGGLRELWVRSGDGVCEWLEKAAPQFLTDYFVERGIQLRESQYADVTPEWAEAYRKICKRMDRGLVVTFDYGFEKRQLFDPRVRSFGTAAAYFQHAVHRDLLARPGQQDLTAHINFTDLIETGEQEGLTTLLLTRQARFLLSLGITAHPLFTPADQVQTSGLAQTVELAETREAARRLILPDGIGEDVKVLVQSKKMETKEWSFQTRKF